MTSGGEARYDLGAALFALHRTGAAACEVVAASPIPDQYSLIESLAGARMQIASPLVESVAKCVDGATYAGLLVRDLADEAEEGALHVFNTIVSKGVPASVAAQRAGLVYGVPKSDLGKYLSVAGDLRAHPALLTDTADRVLFGYVEKICTQEVAETKEEVSKATAVLERPATQTFVEQDHPRDMEGRFATKTGTLSERLGLKKTPVEAPVKAKRAKRAVRSVRAQVAESQTRTATALQQVLRGQKLQQKIRHKMSPAALKDALASGGPVLPKGDPLPDMMKPFPKSGMDYSRIDAELSITVPLEDYQEMLGKMKTSSHGGDKRFRMGHLLDYLRSRALPPPVAMYSPAANSHIGEVASSMRNDPNVGEPPFSVHFSTNDIQQMMAIHGGTMEEALNDSAIDLAESHLEAQGRTYETDPGFTGHRDRIADVIIARMRSGQEPDSQVLIEPTRPGITPITVVQFHINGDIFGYDPDASIAGYQRSANEQQDIKLDPNQVYWLQDTTIPEDGYYDHKKHVNVLTYVAKAESGDDDDGYEGDVLKAAAVLDRTFLETEHPRDVEGRFATKTSTLSARLGQARVQPQAKRVQRVQRAQRATTKPVLQPTGLQVPLHTPLKPQSQALRHMLRQIYSQPAKPAPAPAAPGLPTIPWLFPDLDHQVMDADDFQNLLDLAGFDHKDGALIPDKEPLPLTGAAYNSFVRGDPVGGNEANEQLKGMADEQIWAYNKHYGGIPMKKLNSEPILVDEFSSEGRDKFNKIIDHFFAANPKVSQIVVQDAGEGHVDLLGNSVPLKPLVVVQYGPGVNPHQQDVDLQYVGTYRSNSMHEDPLHVSPHDPKGLDRVFGVPVRMFKLTAPTVQLYGLKSRKYDDDAPDFD